MSRSAELMNHSISLNTIVFLSLVLLITAAYANTFDTQWQFDDYGTIVQNPYIKSFSRLFSHRNIWTRPITFFTYAVNYKISGLDPGSYHVFNLAVHITASFFVFLFLQELLSLEKTNRWFRERSFKVAVTAALFFGLHPVATQAVTYIKQRSASMAGMFCFMAFYFYLRSKRAERCRWLPFTLFTAAFLLAAGSKPIALTLPFIIALAELMFFRKVNRTAVMKIILWLLPFILLALILFAAYLPNLHRVYEKRDFTMTGRLLTESRVVVFYLSLLVVPLPSRLNVDHHFAVSGGILSPFTTALSILVIIALTATALRRIKKNRFLSFMIFWFLINLLMESTILPLELAFEHRLYLPAPGIMAILAAGAVRLMDFTASRLNKEKRPFGPEYIVPLLVVLLLGSAAFARNRVWRNGITLWADAARKSPEKARPRSNLGLAYERAGNIEQAREHFIKALEIDNDYAPAYYHLALIHRAAGNEDTALDLLEEATGPGRYYAPAYNELGVIYGRREEWDLAERNFRTAVEMEKDYAIAYAHLGYVYEQKGHLDEAEKYYRKAVKRGFNIADAYLALGNFLLRMERYKESESAFREGLNIDPGSWRLEFGLGRCLFEQGFYDKSEEHLNRALVLNPSLSNNPIYREILNALRDNTG